jgi:hypothetical protein
MARAIDRPARRKDNLLPGAENTPAFRFGMAVRKKVGMAGSTEEVFDRHLQMFGAGDVDGLMADYTEDSFIISPMGVVKGLTALRGFFGQICKEFADPKAVFNLESKVIEGEVAYITWSADTSANSYSFGTDTFVIRDGKFVAQTFAGVVTPKV